MNNTLSTPKPLVKRKKMKTYTWYSNFRKVTDFDLWMWHDDFRHLLHGIYLCLLSLSVYFWGGVIINFFRSIL